MRRFILILLFACSWPVFANETGSVVKRIIALSPHSVELLFALGAGDNIVATVEYADYPEQALKIPRIGNYNGIQIEKVLALQPDLIMVWKSGNKMADLEKLQSLELPLFYTHPKSIGQIGDDVIRLGKRIGHEKQAHTLAQSLRQRYQSIKAKYADRRSVDVFYQLWHEPMRTVGPNSWIDSLISDCNGHNVFSDTDSDYPIVSLETIIVKKPEVIVIPHHSGDVGAKTEIWNQWQSLDVVKNNRIYTLNGDLLHRFGPRALDGLEMLCNVIDSAR